MGSGMLTINAMHVLGLGSGNSSFTRGRTPVERVPAGNMYSSTKREFTRIAGPRCALKTRRGSRKQKDGSSSNDTLNAAILESTTKQQDEAVTVAVPKKKKEAMPRLANAVKPVNKLKRFRVVLERVWKKPQLAPALMNVAESVLTLLEPRKFPYHANLGIQLVDNFAPVSEECPPTSGLEVTGRIPECFNGVYVRNGSNPQFMPAGGYHVFDGDGMIHAVRFKDGVPSYCCRFVRTYRYVTEKEVGHPLFPHSLGELNGWPGLARMALYMMRGKLGILDVSKRFGTANAGLAFYNGKLLAMSEDDMPYAIAISPEDGDLHSLGRYDISGSEEHFSMTAHPKIDPITGDMFSYSYRVVQAPHVHYWHANPRGEVSQSVTISTIKEPVLLHDFAVTENYAIIPDPIMVFRMGQMVAGKAPVVIDERKVTKFGVLPKFATDDSAIKWFDAPGSSCFHYLNAWEEGDEVVLVGSSNSPPSRALVDLALLYNYFTEYRMNMKTGQISTKRLSDWNIDMGRMNERFLGRKNRYAYLSMAGPWPKLSGIVKFDIEAAAVSSGGGGEVAIRKYSPGCFGSEPFFVPRVWGADDSASEDDGYIVTFLHNEITNVSELGIFDARSPTLEPVATVKIPVRVPYGFHGLFITEEQLANQYPSPLQSGS